jgi:hypothetical protein
VDCLPVTLNWRGVVGASGVCIDFTPMFWAVVVSDILTDGMFSSQTSETNKITANEKKKAIILTIPIPKIWKLQMSTSRKVQVCAMFLLGWFVVGAGIARGVISGPGVSSGNADLDYTCMISLSLYF